MHKQSHSERDEQRMLIQWFKLQYPQDLLFAIPNQLVRGKMAFTIARDGVVAGIPDLMLPKALGGFHGMFIEMKRADGGVLSNEQNNMLSFLTEKGYLAVCCHGFLQAKQVIEEYLRGDRMNH